MKRILVVLFCLSISVLEVSAQRPALGAFYYPWYRSTGSHWEVNAGPDKQKPLLGQYEGSDDAVIAQHLDWATYAGMSFFLMDWWGPWASEPVEGGASDDDIINKVFDHADAIGFKLAICLDNYNGPDFGGTGIMDLKSQAQNGQISHTTYISSSANWFIGMYDVANARGWFNRSSYLHASDGRKVVTFFHWDESPIILEVLQKVYQLRPDIPASSWIWYFGSKGHETMISDAKNAAIWTRQDPNPNYNGHSGSPYIYTSVPSGTWTRYQPIIEDGWGGTWGQYYDFTHWTLRDPSNPRLGQLPPNPEPIVTVSPRFNNGLTLVPSDGGARLTGALNDIRYAAVPPKYVIVTSFNEWGEDSTVEPSVGEGTVYLDILRSWFYSY
jgi:hypothetical protein